LNNVPHQQRLHAPRAFSLIVLALLCLLIAPRAVNAHGYLIRAIPQDRAALERAPARAQYWFSEPLEPRFSRVIVRDANGIVIAEGGVSDADRTLLTVRLPADLPTGAYISDLRIAFASDGHVIAESRVFFIGDTATDLNSSRSGDTVVPLEALWRTLLLASTMVLFGAFILYTLVLTPAWGNPIHRAGGLPPRVMARLNQIVTIALAVAVFANILALLQQTMIFFGAPLDRVIVDNLWSVVRIGTRFGDTWNVRLLLLLLVAAIFGAGVIYRHTQPEIVRPGWAANAWAAALILGSWSVASHAAGSQVLPWFAIFSDWLHGLAVGAWAGGAVVMTLILPSALAPYRGEDRRRALLAVMRRFSRLAVVGLMLVITTGVYNALNWFATPADVGTSYGGALVIKLALVAVLIVFGAAHHIALRPERYQRWARLTHGFQSFIPTLRLEALLVLAVLIGAAWLSATPPPQPDIIAPSPPSFATQIDDNVTTLTLAPGGTGINTMDVQVIRAGVAVENAAVTVQIANPARDQRGVWHPLEPIEGGVYTTTGAEIDQIGTWWALVEVDGVRAAFALTISDDGESSLRSPSLLNLIALLGVIGSGAYALSPLALRLYRRLDLTPAVVTAAVGATLAGIVIVIIGIAASANVFDNYAQLALPPPQIVNPILPDGDSLGRGAALFADVCPTWREAGDFNELVERLPRLRDEAIYDALTRTGWRALPACANQLTETQRWDIVNTIRAFETNSPTNGS